jgi:hypothetical protein
MPASKLRFVHADTDQVAINDGLRREMVIDRCGKEAEGLGKR